MRTIDSFINETLNSRQVQKQIDMEGRIDKTYEKYPELQEIDEKILEIRKEKIMKLLENESSSPDLESKDENDLKAKRAKFLKNNCIAPEFDQEWVICEKCNDTGYVKKGSIRTVCSCMKDELEDAFKAAGLGDFKNIKPSLMDPKAIKNPKNKRAEARKKLDSVMAGIFKGEPQSSLIYSDGAQTGKTFLSVCVTKILIGCGLNAVYVKLEDLYDMSESELEDVRYADFLIIDDFISSSTKSFKIAAALNRILEFRSMNEKFTMLVMGESPSEAVSGSEERVAAKLSHMECI